MKKESRIPIKDAHHLSGAKALDTAFRLLARRDHTCGELLLKLRRRGFDRQVVDGALRRCRELGYLDDAKTARSMAGHLARKGFGPLRIRQALKQKGVEDALVETVLAEGDEEAAQVSAAKKALKKKATRLSREDDPWKRRQIAYRFLAGRGFPASVINQSLDDT